MKKKILIAPLNWGLGHATRCIPIINALLEQGFEPVIASDGVALSLLQKEFPALNTVALPSYNITYAKKGAYFKLKLLKDTPRLLQTIKAEKEALKAIVKTHNISGVISDNRLGLYYKKVPCVFITHQLTVLSGKTTWLSTKMHNKFIKKFDECWVPDSKGTPNLSGKLAHKNTPNIPVKYIGPISRFKKRDTETSIDLLILLSVPEPQRSLLEGKLLQEIEGYKGRIVFVKGVMAQRQHIETYKNATFYNFMTSEALEDTINKSKLVLSRSGYTTVMDLAKLEKNAFFIPTPGQSEQEYLAKRLKKQGFIASCKQKEFTIDLLKQTEHYKGLKSFNVEVDYDNLFTPFLK